MKTPVLLCLLASGVALAAPKFTLDGDATRGEAHYKRLCLSCHGEQGRGDGLGGSELNKRPADFTDPANASRLTEEWVYKIVKDGGPSHGKSALMVSWSGSLKDDEIRDVAAYVLKFKPAKKKTRKS